MGGVSEGLYVPQQGRRLDLEAPDCAEVGKEKSHIEHWDLFVYVWYSHVNTVKTVLLFTFC